MLLHLDFFIIQSVGKRGFFHIFHEIFSASLSSLGFFSQCGLIQKLGGRLSRVPLEIFIKIIQTAVAHLVSRLLDIAFPAFQQAAGLLNAKLMDIGQNSGVHVFLEKPGQVVFRAVGHPGQILQPHPLPVVGVDVFQH